MHAKTVILISNYHVYTYLYVKTQKCAKHSLKTHIHKNPVISYLYILG